MTRSATLILSALSGLMCLQAASGATPAEDAPWACSYDAVPIEVSYRVWLVGQNVVAAQTASSSQAVSFCGFTIPLLQETFQDNGLPLIFHRPDAPEPCPVVSITDSALATTINGFAKNLHENAIGWDDVHGFTTEGQQSGKTYFTPGDVNVYVIHGSLLNQFKGMHVRDIKATAPDEQQGNLIFVPHDVTWDTLAHEFGHAFSLEHVNFLSLPRYDAEDPDDRKKREYCVEYDYFDDRCDYSPANVMWAAEANRGHIAEGQRQRVVCNTFSALNINGDRTGGTFRCPDWSLVDLDFVEGQGPIKACPPLGDPTDPL